MANAISGYGATVSLVDILEEETAAAQANASSEFSGNAVSGSGAAATSSFGQSTARKAKSAYGQGVNSAHGQAALRKAIADLAGKVDGPLTFSKIKEYQAELEKQFTANVRKELTSRGVPTAEDFSLTMSPEGTIAVEAKHPIVKEMVETYLAKNPAVCEQFGYIQALANLERAKSSPASAQWRGLADTKASIQASAVDLFMSSAMDAGMNFSSMMVGFGGASEGAEESTSFYAGLDYKV